MTWFLARWKTPAVRGRVLRVLYEALSISWGSHFWEIPVAHIPRLRDSYTARTNAVFIPAKTEPSNLLDKVCRDRRGLGLGMFERS